MVSLIRFSMAPAFRDSSPLLKGTPEVLTHWNFYLLGGNGQFLMSGSSRKAL